MKKRQETFYSREAMKKLKKRILLLKRITFLLPNDLGTFSNETYYATFDEDGISIYQYDKTESKLKLCERHPWKSWNKVKIDHYLTTSQFIFQGERN